MCVKIQAMVLVKVNMKLQKYAELGPEGVLMLLARIPSDIADVAMQLPMVQLFGKSLSCLPYTKVWKLRW